jgi:putative FmdB family regulatory protein
MPLYEYECDSCGRRFELIQKFSDPPSEACPSCGGAVRKLLSLAAFQFKGSGWYVTDYARKGRAAENGGSSSESKSEKSSPSDKSSSSSSSSEKLPAGSTSRDS